MVVTTPTAASIHELFYDTNTLADDSQLEYDIDQLDSIDEVAGEKEKKYGRASIYVSVFEQMVNTVCDSELHLLTNKEVKVLEDFSYLSYAARFCLVRLILRKTSAWHTLDSMESFKKEVGEDGLKYAIAELCKPLIGEAVKEEPPPDIGVPKVEIIDLTGDSDDEANTRFDITSKSRSNDQDIKPSLDALLDSDSIQPEHSFNFFLEDESSMDLREVLNRLNNDQLKELVRGTKTKPIRATKEKMIEALLLYATTQTSLAFLPKSTKRDNAERIGELKQIMLPFKPKGKHPPEIQTQRLLQMALDKLGKAVRVNSDLYWLVARLNVIYGRCTEYPSSLLVPSLLTSFRKRTYPIYKYQRDSTIWATRKEFIDYFDALWLEKAISEEIDPSPASQRSGTGKLAPRHTDRNKFVTPVPSELNAVITQTPMSCVSGSRPEAIVKKEEDMQENDVIPEEPIRKQTARKVQKIFNEAVFPKWQQLVLYKQEQNLKNRTPGLERFEPGFIYTRIFSKATKALATLRLYKEEAKLIEALLDQPFWGRGKRAKWYVRRVILQTKHLHSKASLVEKTLLLKHAVDGIRQALMDGDTAIVWRPNLVHRLRKLEITLKIPEEDRCFVDNNLRKAETVSFSAVRIKKSSKSLKLDANGIPISEDHKGLQSYFSPVKKVASNEKNNNPATNLPDLWKWKGKSRWVGVDRQEVDVEHRALQYYEAQNFKGFHSESRILTTIFGLLFWDIIFADVPGAFETPYQPAPLDLAEDSFYRARKESIDVRLEEIKDQSRALEILQRHDELYREKKTWCVGVQWDICDRLCLLEIVECLGGRPLSIICRLFCEDYAGRNSGVPDLIVWNYAKRLCKFVEVKGPGDTPQENQKLWFDSLLGAGANVEICRVFDVNEPSKPLKSRKAKQPWTRHKNTKSNGKGKVQVGDSDTEMDSNPAKYSEENPLTLGKRRRRSPDENDNQHPTVHFSRTPPRTPPNPHTNYCEGSPALKRTKPATPKPS